MWLHVNNYCKGAEACLYQEGGITGNIMFCHETSGPLIGWAYKRGSYNQNFTVCVVREIFYENEESNVFVSCSNICK